MDGPFQTLFVVFNCCGGKPLFYRSLQAQNQGLVEERSAGQTRLFQLRLWLSQRTCASAA
ncbi:hypothetical protein RLO149_c040220 [Roseobacter litoralis Och 149]|uniref:Uncharacterized protein n=1 Tax=Roseobacter litoralis (strain ATCC 49566 / DSM 6996 / JCM 21268 / NBRC 15278 / OCh 149) TaxID=391595 RepID=F7ZEM4_ROSLO|nr:hypothetical protein RLO149_c040220 [Roseobacter litoralis Och 149]